MLHVGTDRIDHRIVDRCVTLTESTSPSALLAGSLDAARRYAAVAGRALLEETIEGTARLRGESARSRARLLDERICGSGGVHAFDPLRLAVDVRGTGASGYEIADWMREDDDIHTELAGENVVVAVFGMGERVRETAARLVPALRKAAAARPPGRRANTRSSRRRRRGGRWRSRRARRSSARRRSCRSAMRSGALRPSRSPPTRRGSRTCSPASGCRPRRSNTWGRRWSRGGGFVVLSDRRLRTLRVVVE